MAAPFYVEYELVYDELSESSLERDCAREDLIFLLEMAKTN